MFNALFTPWKSLKSQEFKRHRRSCLKYLNTRSCNMLRLRLPVRKAYQADFYGQLQLKYTLTSVAIIILETKSFSYKTGKFFELLSFTAESNGLQHSKGSRYRNNFQLTIRCGVPQYRKHHFHLSTEHQDTIMITKCYLQLCFPAFVVASALLFDVQH